MHPLLYTTTVIALFWGSLAPTSGQETTTDQPLFNPWGFLTNRQATLSDEDIHLDRFYPEIAILLVFALFFVNYFYGVQQNRSRVTKITRAVLPLFEAQFSTVGKDNQAVLKDDEANYIFYGSGRRHCYSAHGFLQLTGRQDIFRTAFSMLNQTGDRLELEIQLLPNEFTGFVFAVVPQRAVKYVRESRYDVQTFGRQGQYLGYQDKKYAVFMECTEHRTLLLERSGLATLLDQPDCALQELFVTDQPLEKPTELPDEPIRTIQAVVTIKDVNQLAPVVRAVELVLSLIDYIPEHHSIRAESKTRLIKAREDAVKDLVKAAQHAKQDELQQRKRDKKRQEAEQIDKLSPEAQRKWEEKQKKRALKKKQSKSVRRG
ncbi:hypothetical protein IWQ61_009604 [Dispira simplex]|nr:hypothetical protein IWQ61_009604 [Dispira simplex]